MKNKIIYTKSCTLILSLFLLFSIADGSSVNDANPAGIWLGTLKIPGVELRIALTISASGDSGYSATMNSLDQGSGELPMDVVRYSNGHLFVKGTDIAIEFEGEIDYQKDTYTSKFRQGPAKFPLLFSRVGELPTISHPQEPKKPYPYNSEDVEYENKKVGIKIAGTLTYPKSGGPFAAIILLTGSGKQNRDEEVFGHRPFLVLSDYLTRQGFAVLRCDDRGIGGTTGEFKGSTTADFAEDALAGVEYLKTRPEINPHLIGLVGHSEGGMMAPIAASLSSDVAFIVLMAGVGIKFDDIVLFQQETMWKKAGMSEEDMAQQRSWSRKVSDIVCSDADDSTVARKVRSLYSGLSDEEKSRLHKTPESLQGEIKWATDPWHRYAAKYDAKAVLQKVKCPVLAVNGEKDRQVSAKENLSLIENALKEGGNPHFKVAELKGLNHLFQTADTGDQSEYAKIEETMSPDAMKLVTDWIKEQGQTTR
jgi:pimeloyl-ACP methyl ester carboxylesterase